MEVCVCVRESETGKPNKAAIARLPSLLGPPLQVDQLATGVYVWIMTHVYEPLNYEAGVRKLCNAHNARLAFAPKGSTFTFFEGFLETSHAQV